MAILSYLPKVKRGLGLALGAHFLYDFSKKCAFFNTISVGKVSTPYLFPFPRYQAKCVIKFLCRQLMASQTLRFISDQPPKQWLTGWERGEDGNTKIWISRQPKSFLDEIKNIFHSLWRAIIWLKTQIW